MKTCFIIVDCQNDFVEGGALAVSGGMQACKNIKTMLQTVHYDQIVITEDFHPSDHCSFSTNGGTWPVHCVQHTDGAELQHDITDAITSVTSCDNTVPVNIVRKGADKNAEEYGATIIADGIDRFDIGGIALDYCVLETARLLKQHYPKATVAIKLSCTAAVDSRTENRNKIESACKAAGISWEA